MGTHFEDGKLSPLGRGADGKNSPACQFRYDFAERLRALPGKAFRGAELPSTTIDSLMNWVRARLQR